MFNCEAFDTGKSGFEVGGEAGYDGVHFENCRAFANSNDGFVVWGPSQKSSRNIVMRSCTAYSNLGMAGLWISGGENGLIEDCLAYNNACVNIWAFNSINITMRRCEVFRGRPTRDAAGFDIDYGVQASTLEYSYSHDNEGDAVLLMGMGKGLFNGFRLHSSHNIMRYCVAEGHAPVDIIETFMHGRVYNNQIVAWGKGSNAVILGGWPDESDKDTWKGGGWPSDTHVTNNIIVAQGGAALLWVDDHATHQNNQINHNLYFSELSNPELFYWGGRKNGLGFWHGDRKTGTYPPKAFASLADFQKESGQDKQSLYADPQILKPGSGDFGRLPLNSARLQTASPAWGRGAKVVLDEAWLKARRAFTSETGAAAYGIPMDPQPVVEDYFGGKIKAGAKDAIGVQQP